MLLDLIILGVGYYTLSYGIYLWKTENKKLAGFGVFLIAFLGTVVPIINLHIKL